MKKQRKAIHTSSIVFMSSVITIATCNDGSMWKFKHAKNEKWERMEDIPE